MCQGTSRFALVVSGIGGKEAFSSGALSKMTFSGYLISLMFVICGKMIVAQDNFDIAENFTRLDFEKNEGNHESFISTNALPGNPSKDVVVDAGATTKEYSAAMEEVSTVVLPTSSVTIFHVDWNQDNFSYPW